MSQMRRKLLFGLVFMLAVLLIPAPIGAAAEKKDVDIYLYDPCGKCLGAVGYGGCGECKLVEEIAGRLNKMLLAMDCDINYLNARFDPIFGEERDERLAALGLSPQKIDMPTLFIGDAVFLADGTQDAEIRKYIDSGLADYPGYEAVLAHAKERAEKMEVNRVVYLYAPHCESCQRISQWLATALPKGYELVKYDLSTHLGLLMERHVREEFAIAEDDLYVPLIVYGNYYFMGSDAILSSLPVILSVLPDQKTYVIREEPATTEQP